MNHALECHPATHNDLIQAHTNVHAIWSKGLPIEEHIPARMNAPHHRRANWYVGKIQGETVVSLGAYPMKLKLENKTYPGYSIGSVYTK